MVTLQDWVKDEAGWHRKRGVGWVYLYPKGGFRGKENQVVISTSLTGGSNPQDRQNIGFGSKHQAIEYAKKWMRSHPHG